MNPKSNFQDFDVCNVMAPATLAATASSDPVDLDEYDGCTMVFHVGIDAALDGSNYWTFSLSECATVGGSYTAVAAADTDDGSTSPTGSVIVNSTAEDDLAYKLTYLGNLRFLKAVLTETGTVSGPVSILAVLSRKRMGPMSQASIAFAS